MIDAPSFGAAFLLQEAAMVIGDLIYETAMAEEGVWEWAEGHKQEQTR